MKVVYQDQWTYKKLIMNNVHFHGSIYSIFRMKFCVIFSYLWSKHRM